MFAQIGAWAERKLGAKVGVSPGSEMLKAIAAAQQIGAKIALIDQDIEITLRKFSKSLSWKEWMQIYLKSRDSIQKVITGFENLNGDFVVHKTSTDVLFLIRPEFTNVDEIADKAVGLVVLNTQKNVKFVISNWDKLSKLKELCIYFVNPKSK